MVHAQEAYRPKGKISVTKIYIVQRTSTEIVSNYSSSIKMNCSSLDPKYLRVYEMNSFSFRLALKIF